MASGKTDWHIFTTSVPWRDIIIGFIAPKVIFYVSMNRPWMVAGVSVAIGWCAGLFALQYARRRTTNIWAVLALVTMLFQMIPVIMGRDPNLNFIAGGVTTLVYGLFFTGSSAIGRPIMQIIAEHMGARGHVSPRVASSPYYRRAWTIVTAVWGIVYIVESFVIFALSADRSGALLTADAISGWPTMVVLIYFTVKFPRLYWKRTIGPEAV